jgi:ABC-type nitrate/sulfonate/bicarbonate transport system substrate-binding protein
MSTVTEKLRTIRVSMMNAVHDLPLLVARDEGYFRDEGLNLALLTKTRWITEPGNRAYPLSGKCDHGVV